MDEHEGDRELALRTSPPPEMVQNAWRVARIIADSPGLTARLIADAMNTTGGEFDERVGARQVRRLIWIARRHLGEPIVAAGGSGYRMAESLCEAMDYAEASRRFGRDYMALAERVEANARKRFAGQMELLPA